MNYSYRNGNWYLGEDTIPLPDHYKLNHPQHGKIQLDRNNKNFISLEEPATFTEDLIEEINNRDLNKPKEEKGFFARFFDNLSKYGSPSAFGGIWVNKYNADKMVEESENKDYNENVSEENDNKLRDSWVPELAISLINGNNLDRETKTKYLNDVLDYTLYRTLLDSFYSPLSKSSILENLLYEIYGNELDGPKNFALYIHDQMILLNQSQGMGNTLSQDQLRIVDSISKMDNYTLMQSIGDNEQFSKLLDSFIQKDVLTIYGNKVKQTEEDLKNYYSKYPFGDSQLTSILNLFSSGKNYRNVYLDRIDKFKSLLNTISLGLSSLGIDNLSLDEIEQLSSLFDTFAELSYGNYNSNKEDIINEGIQQSKLDKLNADKFKAILFKKYVAEALALGEENARKNMIDYLQKMKNDSQGFGYWLGDTLYGGLTDFVGTGVELGAIGTYMLNPVSLFMNIAEGGYNVLSGNDEGFLGGFADTWNSALNSSAIQWSEDLKATGMISPNALNKALQGERYTELEIEYLESKNLIRTPEEKLLYLDGVIRKNQGETFGRWIAEVGHETDVLSPKGFSDMLRLIGLMKAVGLASKGITWLGSGMRGIAGLMEESAAMAGKLGNTSKGMLGTAKFLNNAGITTEASAPFVAAAALDFGYAKSAYDTNVSEAASYIYANPEMYKKNYDGEIRYNNKFLDMASKYALEHKELFKGAENYLREEANRRMQEIVSTHNISPEQQQQVYNSIVLQVLTEYAASYIAPRMMQEAKDDAASSAAVAWALTTIPDGALFSTIGASLFSTPKAAMALTTAMQGVRNYFSGLGKKIGIKSSGIPKVKSRSLAIESFIRNADGTYSVKAKELTAGQLGRLNLIRAAGSGFLTNYFLDVGVGVNTGMFNTEWDNYINTEFNPDSTYKVKNVLVGAIAGGLNAMVDKQSFYDGMMGFGGGGLTPTFRLASKSKPLVTTTTNDEGNTTRKINWKDYFSQIKDAEINFLPTDILGITGKKRAKAINESRNKYAATIETWLNELGGKDYLSSMNHMYDIYKRTALNNADPEVLNADRMANNAEYIALLSKATFQSNVEGEGNTNPITDVVLRNMQIHANRGTVTVEDINNLLEIAKENKRKEEEGELPVELDEKTASILNDINRIIRDNPDTNISDVNMVNMINEVTENALEQLNVYKDYVQALNRYSSLFKSKGIYDPTMNRVAAMTEAKIKSYERALAKHQENLKTLKQQLANDEKLKGALNQRSTLTNDRLGVLSTVYQNLNLIDARLSVVEDAIAERLAALKEIKSSRKELEKEIDARNKERAEKKKKGVPIDTEKLKEDQTRLMANSQRFADVMYGVKVAEGAETQDVNLSLLDLIDEAKILRDLKQFKHVKNTDATLEERFLTLNDILNLNNDDLQELLYLYRTYPNRFSELLKRVFESLNEEQWNTLDKEAEKADMFLRMVKEIKVDLALGLENSPYFNMMVQESKHQLDVLIWAKQYENWGKNIKTYEEFVEAYELELSKLGASGTAEHEGLKAAIEKNLGKTFLNHYLELRNLLINGVNGRGNLNYILEANFDKLLSDKPEELRKKAKEAGKGILYYYLVNLDALESLLPKKLLDLDATQIEQLATYLKNKGIDLEGIDLTQDVIQPMLTYLNKSITEKNVIHEALKGKNVANTESEEVRIKKVKAIAATRVALGSYATKSAMKSLLKEAGILDSELEGLNTELYNALQNIVSQLISAKDILKEIETLLELFNDEDSIEGALLEILSNRINNAIITGDLGGLVTLYRERIIPSREASRINSPITTTFSLASYEYLKARNPKSRIVLLYEENNVSEFLKNNDINSLRREGKKPDVIFLYNPTEEATNKADIQDELSKLGKNPDYYNKNTTALVAVAIQLDARTETGKAIEIDGKNYQIIGFLSDLSSQTSNANIVREAIDNSFTENQWNIVKDEEGNPYHASFEVKSTNERDIENYNNPEARLKESRILKVDEKGRNVVFHISRFEKQGNQIRFRRNDNSLSEPLIRPALSQTINKSGNTLELLKDSPSSIVNFNFITRRLRQKIGAIVDYCRENPEVTTSTLTHEINNRPSANNKGSILFTAPLEEYEKTKLLGRETAEQNVALRECLYLTEGYNYVASIDGDNLVIQVREGARTIIEGTTLTIDLNSDASLIDALVGEWIYKLSEIDTIDNQGQMNSIIHWLVRTGADFEYDVAKEEGRKAYRTLLFEENLLQLPPVKNTSKIDLTPIMDTKADKELAENNRKVIEQTYSDSEGQDVQGLSRVGQDSKVPTGLKKVRTMFNAISQQLHRPTTPIDTMYVRNRENSLAVSGNKTINAVSSVLGNVTDDIFNRILEGRPTKYSKYENLITEEEYNVLVSRANDLLKMLEARGMHVVGTLVPAIDERLRNLIKKATGKADMQLNYADLVVMLPDGNLAIVDYKTALGEISKEFYEGYYNSLNLYAQYFNMMLLSVLSNALGNPVKVTLIFLAEQPLLSRPSDANIFDIKANDTTEGTEVKVSRTITNVPIVDKSCELSLIPLALQKPEVTQKQIDRRSILFAHKRGISNDALIEVYGDKVNLIIETQDDIKNMAGKSFLLHIGDGMVKITINELKQDTVLGTILEEGSTTSDTFTETITDFKSFLDNADSITEITEGKSKEEITEKPAEKSDNSEINEQKVHCVGSETPPKGKSNRPFGNRGTKLASNNAI